MLLPIRRLHHFFDAGARRLTEESQQTFLLGDAIFALCFGPLRRFRDGYTVRPIKPKGDKVMRMRVHTPTLEAGKVLLKKDAPWLDELRTEVLAFPYGKHDDQVDALSQLMTWAEDWRVPKYSIRPWRR